MEGGFSFERSPERKFGGKVTEKGKPAEPKPRPFIINAEITRTEGEISPIKIGEIITGKEGINRVIQEGKRIGAENIHFTEAGNVSPVVINYPSGLRLVLDPIFDGRLAIESFTGCFKASLVFPAQYSQDQTYQWTEEELQHTIPKGFTKISLNLGIPVETAFPFEKVERHRQKTTGASRVSQSGSIPTYEEVLFTLSNEFSAGYLKQGDKVIRIVSFSLADLKKSEQHFASLFHELGHQAIYGAVEELVVQLAANQADIFRKDDMNLFELTILPSYREKLAKALQRDLAPEIKEIVRAIISIKNDLISTPPEDVHQLVMKLKETKEGEKALSLFHERTAWAKDRMMIRAFSKKHGATFQFNRAIGEERIPRRKPVLFSSRQFKRYQTPCLQSYSDGYNDSRFVQGFRG